MDFRKLLPITAIICLSAALLFHAFCDQTAAATSQKNKSTFEKEWNLVSEYQK
ncbi:MAG: hypothetical protein GX639_09355, partial [Fibrobacter sp.]|nr:hypothetical protein [Fibrobacter sp.]